MIFKRKTKINLWVFDLYEDESFLYFKKYEKMLSGFFESHFFDYYNITIKRFGKDILNPNEHNLTILPCDTFKFLLKIFEHFPHDIYDVCVKNNIRFIISYIREFIHPPEMDDFENIFEEYFLSKKQDYSNLRVFLNGYAPPINTKYKKLFVTFDTFQYLTRTYLNGKIFKNFKLLKNKKIIKNRKYNFSLFAGLLEGRQHRVFFLLDCFKKKLITDKFFYNTVCFDMDDPVREIIRNTIYYRTNENLSFKETKEFIEKITSNKLYDVNGDEIDKINLYEKHFEFQVPYQMLDSYINIVLETRIDSPSITEKLYKPIIAGIPFVWYGYHNILKYLQSNDYKKYPFIDYTFDTMEDPIERRISLVQEIIRLNGLNLKKEIISCKDISKHNQKIFYKNTKKFKNLEFYLNGRV